MVASELVQVENSLDDKTDFEKEQMKTAAEHIDELQLAEQAVA